MTNKKKFLEGLNKHLLIEGRKNNVIKKYPYMATEYGQKKFKSLLGLFMTNDPSGNQKYLMWMADMYHREFVVAYAQALNASSWFPGVEVSPSNNINRMEKEYLLQVIEDSNADVDVEALKEIVTTMALPAIKAQVIAHALTYDQLVMSDWPLLDYYQTWKDALDSKFGGTRVKVPSAQIFKDLAHEFHFLLPYIKNKDINFHKDKQSLYDIIIDANSKKLAKEQEKDKKQAAKAGARIIWEEGKVAVIRPETTEASCLFGKGTRWCVSATASGNMFDHYSRQGQVFYFFFFPGHTKLHEGHVNRFDKIAVVLDEKGNVGSVWDAEDNMIAPELLEEAWEEYRLPGDPSWMKKFELVMSKIKADALKNPSATSKKGIDEDYARELIELVENEFRDEDKGFSFMHEFEMDNQMDPLTGAHYIEVYPTIKITMELNPKVVRKMERWEEMHEPGPDVSFYDQLFGDWNEKDRRGEYRAHIEQNTEKIINNLLRDRSVWPINTPLAPPISPLEKYVTSYVSVSGVGFRDISVDLSPLSSYETATEGVGYKEFTKAEDWVRYLRRKGKEEMYLKKHLHKKAKVWHIGTIVQDTLADAGITAPSRKSWEATGQIDLPLNHYPLDDIEVDEPYTLQERRMKKK